MEATEADALAEAVAAALFARDTAAQSLGMALEAIAPGFARLVMAVRDDMLNGHGMCHGGLIFTLADTAFAYACNSRNDSTVAAAAEIQFLSPGRAGETLVAVAHERAVSGRVGIYDVDVTDRASGRIVAVFRGRSQRIAGTVLADGGGAR
ncbi:MAG TPA: hydroxyphenylacetyl-CoA thioesterase PaaI [Candidatus Sulfotelmatobacter sp.]|nr:hydroxyphenylacetyl-CoA thioesterase PaaI [Candidatus Sulfotelmatobacter sp.]